MEENQRPKTNRRGFLKLATALGGALLIGKCAIDDLDKEKEIQPVATYDLQSRGVKDCIVPYNGEDSGWHTLASYDGKNVRVEEIVTETDSGKQVSFKYFAKGLPGRSPFNVSIPPMKDPQNLLRSYRLVESEDGKYLDAVVVDCSRVDFPLSFEHNCGHAWRNPTYKGGSE